MGVLSTHDRVKNAELLNSVIHEQTTETSTVEAEIDERNDRQKLRHSKACLKMSRAPRPQSYIRNTGRKAKGCVNSRKFENDVFLSHLIETEDFSDLSIADFMVKSTSAFEQLFEDQSQMNRWSDFVNLKGEDQDRYLCDLSHLDSSQTPNQLNQRTKTNSDFQVAEKKFQNVDHKIKLTLKGRNISMSGLKYFEEEMLSVFKDMNETVLISLIPSSMDRLLIHGICQYMNLSSESHPRHVVQIENLSNQFHPPDMLLSQYLERIR
ncbi:R3H domain-containing protein 4-like [Dendronephthya gigantea]|uniref:R3H domain-containing protein 4-like n=1 Tax=Dendronephthya gigantea TaxID=151771 RepID=UPI00106D7615|nr:R3H domain-containing protein 4-like [Dendronephthya gigantea]